MVELFMNKFYFTRTGGGVMAKVLDCGLKVNEFELQPRYYVHFWTNTIEKGMNLILSVMGWIVSPLSFYKDGFDIK